MEAEPHVTYPACAGWSEFGVLGNGTDHEYNMLDGAVKLSYEPKATPARVRQLLIAAPTTELGGYCGCAAPEDGSKEARSGVKGRKEGGGSRGLARS